MQTKLIKFSLILLISLFLCFGCGKTENKVIAQQNTDEIIKKETSKVFHKEFLGDGVSLTNSILEFRKEGVFINSKQKGLYNVKGSTSLLLARYSDTNRFIYVLVTDVAQGTCGYNTFTLVTVDEFENVKVHKPSPRYCSGEVPTVKFYHSNERDYPFTVDISQGLRFNLESGEWKLLGKK